MRINLKPAAFLFDGRTRISRFVRIVGLWTFIIGGSYLLAMNVLAPMMVDAAGLQPWSKPHAIKTSPVKHVARWTPATRVAEPAVLISFTDPSSRSRTRADDERKHERRRYRRKKRPSVDPGKARQEWMKVIREEAAEAERRDRPNSEADGGEGNREEGGGRGEGEPDGEDR
jgi:hypothetical protein